MQSVDWVRKRELPPVQPMQLSSMKNGVRVLGGNFRTSSRDKPENVFAGIYRFLIGPGHGIATPTPTPTPCVFEFGRAGFFMNHLYAIRGKPRNDGDGSVFRFSLYEGIN